MKLLFCKKCQDVFKLDLFERSCKCGNVKGHYIDELNAEYSGKYALPLGFSNQDLMRAIRKQPHDGLGEKFTAFVIPKKCPTYKRRYVRKKPDKEGE